MRKIAYLLGSATAVLGLTLLGAGAATASPALVHGGSVKPLATVDAHYSQYLAGEVVEGNGLQPYSDIRAHPSLPVEPICDEAPDTSAPFSPAAPGCADNSGVLPDSLAIGVAMGQNLSTGGQVYGLGAVLDDNRTFFSPTSTAEPVDAINWTKSTCLPDQYTVETGLANHSASPQPVPTADLFPALFGGADICLNEGTVGDWLELYHSTHLATMSAIVGPSESNDNDLFDFHFAAGDFRAPAIGITGTDGNVAANLTTGTLTLFGSEGIGLTLIVNNGVGAHQERVTFSQQNLGTYTGTESGGDPSVSNPQTLTIGAGDGHGSSISILVP